MYKSKNKSTSSSDVSAEKPPITIEEIDCERRGYKLTDKTLGTGAYAKVKLAYVSPSKRVKHPWLKADLDGKDDNRVAIKIISKKNAPAEYLEKFMPREIDALNATCRHRNVITLYETFRSETKIYLVMDYAAKGDLLEFINSKTRRGQPLTEEKAKFLFRQLVLGITHCHQRNVVHRDLKCENVLIDEHDIIKVTDFGFATRFPTSKCKFLDTFCGSYAYAAPEILSACKYDGKLADVWSLGVILFAMTCGKLPFNDKSLKYLIEQTKKKVNFPDKLNLSSDLRDLVQGILVHDANGRMTLHEILFHPWLAMVKVPKQSSSIVTTKTGRKMSEKEWDKSTPCLTGTNTPERRPRPLGVPRPQKKARRPPAPSPVQFIVATQRDSSTRKSAIPSGTWSPQASTPEPGHVTKFLRDKNNNDVMKLLMNASPERSPSPVRLCKLGPDRQPNGCQATQACPTEKRPTTGQRSADGSGSTNTSQASKGGVSARLAQEGVHKSSMKSGVFLRTVHTLYKCKKAEDALAEKQTADMERNCSPTNHQQGFLTPLNVDYEAPEKYNFPPVSSRATHEDRSEHQHATSSRLSRLSTWRNPLACARNRKLAFASHAERHGYSSGRSGRGVCYEYTNSPLGITRLGKNSGGCHETSSDSEGSPCGRETRESCVSQPRQLVSKLTVHVVK